jgi:CHASE1-domain containing sensor protein
MCASKKKPQHMTSLSLSKIKRSGEEKSSSDKTPRSLQSKLQSSRCLPTRYDLIIVILSILVTAAGLSAGLGYLFSAMKQDIVQGQHALFNIATYQTQSVQTTIINAIRLSLTTTEFFQVIENITNVDYLNGFIPFVEDTTLLVSGIRSVNVLVVVKNSSMNTFIQDMRSKGYPYTNFSVTGRNADNTLIPYYPYPTSYVLTMTAPFSKFDNQIGYDAASSSIKTQTIEKAISTGELTCTPLTVLPSTNESSIVFFQPIYDTAGDPVGLVTTPMIISTLLADSISQGFTLYAIMQVFDLSAANDTASEFLYSTVLQSQVPFQGVSVDDLTVQQHIEMQNLAPYTVKMNIRVADRNWQVVFIPTSQFQNMYNDFTKWIIMSVIFAAAGLLILLLMIFIKRWEYSNKMRNLDQQRVIVLEESRERVQNIMNRITDTERQIRTIINAIPDFITVITAEGKIVVSNASFDRQFGFTDVDYQKGVNISSVLPSLKDDFYNQPEQVEIKTQAKTRFASMIPVQISVHKLKQPEEQDEEEQMDVEAFVVVARNLSDRHKLLENMQQQEAHLKNILRYAEFDAQFTKNERFREGFMKFCKQAFSDENVSFLNQVRKYRKSSVEKRIQMQHEIYTYFLKIGSKHQLNISSELSNQMEIRISKSLGDVDVFHDVEELVKSMIVVDSYPRYLKHLEIQGDSV